MKRETILKVILVLVMGITLFVNPINVFATSLDELWTDYEDQGSKDQLTDDTQQTTGEPKEEPKEETPQQPTTTPSTPTKPTTQEKEELPKAGLVEDTMMVVAIAVLGMTSVYTFKKANEYNNI